MSEAMAMRRPLHEHPGHPVTLSAYAARGLRIALVGGSAVGKTHVYSKLDAMRTRQNGLRLFERTIPRDAFRYNLDELKRIIADTHDLPNPMDHIYVVWYFPGERWENSDDVAVEELSRLCEVIVVVAKGDLRTAQVDPNTGKTAAEQLEEAVRLRFRNISVIHCSDPTLNPTLWVPTTCKNGHDRSNFEIRVAKASWKCAHVGEDGSSEICNDSHTGVYPPKGYDELLEVSLSLLPSLHARAEQRIKDVERWKEQKERRKTWFMVAVGLLLVGFVMKIGVSSLHSRSTVGSDFSDHTTVGLEISNDNDVSSEMPDHVQRE